MNFYDRDSDLYYIQSDYWAEERRLLLSNGCELLDRKEANKFNLNHFFYKKNNDIKPNLSLDFRYFALPYELDDELSKGLTVDEVLLEIISENMEGYIYLASTDKDKCCFIKCTEINEDIIYNLYHTHINTPFIIFSQNPDFFILIDFDLPLQVIGYRNNIISKKGRIESNIGQDGWNTVITRYNNYKNLPSLFKKYYYFLLPTDVKNRLDD